MKRDLAIWALLLMLAVHILSAMVTAQPESATLEPILGKAAEQRKTYITEFANLLAQETKTFEIFDKKGKLKKGRSILSNFIVYRLASDPSQISEYRSIISVDGRKMSDSDKRAQEFFEDLMKAGSSRKEFEKIEKEGSRFDEEISLSLFTIIQGVPLAENLRPYFNFSLNNENEEDASEYIISYRQSRPSPYILTDAGKVIDDGKLALVFDIEKGSVSDWFLEGKLWIEKGTFRIKREERNLLVKQKGTGDAQPLSETIFEYEAGDFEILTPRKISYSQFRLERGSIQKRPDILVTLQYSNFTKPDVTVESADVSN